MSGNQDVVGGFDLDAFVGQATGSGMRSLEVSKSLADGGSKKAVVSAKHEPERPVREFLNQRVQVRMTDAEFRRLEEAAGMVPVSTYVRKFLQDHGLI